MRLRKKSHPEALAHSVEDAARRISVGRSMVYALIGQKALRTVKIGQRTLVPESELRRFLADRLEATG